VLRGSHYKNERGFRGHKPAIRGRETAEEAHRQRLRPSSAPVV
jgi:hypothetical protein